MKLLFILVCFLICAYPGTLIAQWTQMSGPEHTAIPYILIAEQNGSGGANLILSANIGLLASTNSGMSWTDASTGLPSGSVSCLLQHNSKVFAGTDYGVYVSTNFGGSWSPSYAGLHGGSVSRLAHSGPNLFAGYFGGGVYLSTDDGVSWSDLHIGLVDTLHYYSQYIYALTSIDNNVFAATMGGIYRTTDNGNSWIKVLDTMYVSTLLPVPDGLGNINLFAGTTSGFGGMFFSSDKGDTWMPLSSVLPATNIYTLDAYPNGTGGMIIFAQGYISTDNGASWSIAPSTITPPFASVDDGAGGTLIFARGGTSGMSVSTDYGASWTPRNFGLSYPEAVHLVSAPDGHGGTTLFDLNNYIYRSTDESVTWNVADTFPCVSALAPYPVGPGDVKLYAVNGFYGNARHLFIFSTDGGLTWKTTDTAKKLLKSQSLLRRINTLVPVGDGKGGIIIYGTFGKGLVQSTDEGYTWVRFAPQFDSTILPVQALAAGPDGAGGVSILVGSKGGVYRSSDYGATWDFVNRGFGMGVWFVSITGYPNGSGSTDYFGILSGHGGAPYSSFYSSDNGLTWTNLGIDNIIPKMFIAAPPYIFINGYGNHLFISADNGFSWSDIAYGLPDKPLNTIACSDQNLFAAPQYMGVWKWPLAYASEYRPIDLTAIGDHPVTAKGSRVQTVARLEKKGSTVVLNIHQRLATSSRVNGKIALIWTRDNHPNFLNYRIYADTAPHPSILLDSVCGGQTDTTRLICGLDNARPFYFRVTAMDNTGYENDYSNEVSAVTLPYTPPPVLKTIPADGQVTIHWGKDPHADFSHYVLYGDTNPHPQTVIDPAITSIDDTSRVVTGLTNGVAYYFRVQSIDNFFLECDSSYDVPVMPNPFVYPVNNGWNILSVPTIAGDYSKTAIFPFSVSAAYLYGDGYSVMDTLTNGYGYWVRYNGDQYISLGGTKCMMETVSVRAGWNMIGGIAVPVDVSQILSSPGGIETSQYFGFGKGYGVSDTLWPSQGYWVKVDQDAQLIISISGMEKVAASLGRIRIHPTADLPPPPPDGSKIISRRPLPAAFGLLQCYPNPFNPSTIIQYQLPDVQGSNVPLYKVSLRIYNILGQLVATLVDGVQDAGYRQVEWNASGFVSGMYLYRLVATCISSPSERFTKIKKMVLVK